QQLAVGGSTPGPRGSQAAEIPEDRSARHARLPCASLLTYCTRGRWRRALFLALREEQHQEADIAVAPGVPEVRKPAVGRRIERRIRPAGADRVGERQHAEVKRQRAGADGSEAEEIDSGRKVKVARQGAA